VAHPDELLTREPSLFSLNYPIDIKWGGENLQSSAAVLVSWALPGDEAAAAAAAAFERLGCVMAAMAAKFWTVIGVKRPAAATALVSVAELLCWAPRPVRAVKG